jgi:hypothetical protein
LALGATEVRVAVPEAPGIRNGLIVVCRPLEPVTDRLTVPVKENNGLTAIVDVANVPTVVVSKEEEADRVKSG